MECQITKQRRFIRRFFFWCVLPERWLDIRESAASMLPTARKCLTDAMHKVWFAHRDTTELTVSVFFGRSAAAFFA